jgi:Second Messenger Oligonucleotide or Dinucleotide Synthetase domain
MWIAVTPRFSRFYNALQLTAAQIDDGLGKQLGVRQCLQRAYWGETTDSPPGFMVGSWGKSTAIRPPSDIDIFMQLPVGVYERFNTYVGNGQSALLQEVKGHLETTYSQTRMRGDGQVVLVAFNTVQIEVVPVFNYDSAGSWVMPDTHGGGSWKTVKPAAEVAALDSADAASCNNARKLIQMMKAWRAYCSVPIKSFLIEVLVSEFISTYEHRQRDFFYYDWFVRDFLRYLIGRQNGYIIAPSSGEIVLLGDGWLSRAETAYGRAVKACDYEREDWVALAGGEWQKIFGDRIPAVIS